MKRSKFSDFLKYVVPYWGKVVISILANILSSLFSVFSITMIIPFLGILFETQEMVKEPVPFELSIDAIKTNFYYYLSNIIVEQGKEAALVFVIITVLVMVIFRAGFMYIASYTLASVKFKVIRDIRSKLYQKIVHLPFSYFSEEKKGDMISRMSGDVQQVQVFLLQVVRNLIKSPVMIIVYMYTLFFMSVKLTLFVLAVLPIAGLVIGRVGKKLRSGSVQGQHILGSLVSIIEETLFGIRIIKAFNAEEKSIGKFRKNNQYFTNLMKKVERRRVLAHPLSELMGTCVVVMIMYFGGQMILNNEGGMTSQGFIGYLLVFSQVMTPAKSLSTIYYNIQKGMASFDRLKEILLIENPVKDHENAISKSSFDDKIEYNNVWFKYDDVFVLKNIEFTLYKGQTIAIVGPSGAGKSTLVDLLPRFYDAIEGDILIDGISLKNLKQHDIRNLMGIVSQESILFNDTVYNNIAFGDKNVTMEEVIKAAKVANAHDFIVQMDKDYQTNVGDRGIRLSGGQRQRITIARAILMNPPILIMDEATSSLDSESEKMVQNAIFNLMKNRTSIVIAHRLSTIMKADQILVMQDGAIVERGKYQELLDKKGLFKHLHDKQFD